MEYRQLGNSGVRVSIIGLGTNRFGSKEVGQTDVDQIIDQALDLGINFFDTANVYTEGRSERAHRQSCLSQQVFISEKKRSELLGCVALSADASR